MTINDSLMLLSTASAGRLTSKAQDMNMIQLGRLKYLVSGKKANSRAGWHLNRTFTLCKKSMELDS